MAGLLPDYVAGVGGAPAAPRPTLTAAPNPFSPRVEIELALPTAVEGARLAIFDLAGRQVRELAAGAMGPGAQAFTWDGCDDAGRAVASGSYLCRLEARSGVTADVKLVLVR